MQGFSAGYRYFTVLLHLPVAYDHSADDVYAAVLQQQAAERYRTAVGNFNAVKRLARLRKLSWSSLFMSP